MVFTQLSIVIVLSSYIFVTWRKKTHFKWAFLLLLQESLCGLKKNKNLFYDLQLSFK